MINRKQNQSVFEIVRIVGYLIIVSFLTLSGILYLNLFGCSAEVRTLSMDIPIKVKHSVSQIESDSLPARAKQDIVQFIVSQPTLPVAQTKPVILETKTTVPVKKKPSHVEHGIASHMGHGLHGRIQASGSRHNKHDLICAHKTLPFGTKVRITNKSNGKSVIVTVTDRGPFGPGRIVDLSLAAAKEIDIVKKGITKVKLEKL